MTDVTVAVAMEMRRMRALPQSAAYRYTPSVASSCRVLKVADEPTPSAKPLATPFGLPPPTSVVTTSKDSTMRRMRLLPQSEMYSTPEKKRTPPGSLNVAAVPMPLLLPALMAPAPPASVTTAPVEIVIARTRLLYSSATKRVAPISDATLAGQ